jgi:small subunit ribosomal protein S17
MSDVSEQERGARKERKGTVVSKSGDKSLVVRVERRKPHPFYGKVVRHSRKFHVHDAENAAKPGDQVRIVECRPMSKMKRWRLVEVLKAQETGVEPS